jgi:hypothetical protein
MKSTSPLSVLFCLFLTVTAPLFPAFGQSNAFTYQGRLNSNSGLANGNYDFQFILFNVSQFGFPVGPILTNANVAVNEGIFTTTLDFGDGIFVGTNLWLDISVRTNGNGLFNELLPRHLLTPVPFASYANTAGNLSGTLSASQISGTLTLTQLPAGVVTNGASGLALTGTLTGNSTGFTGELAGDVTGTQGATVVGSVGGSPAANVHAAEMLANSATTNSTPNTLVLRDTNGNFTATMALAMLGLRTVLSSNGPSFISADVIGGSTVNTVTPGVTGAVIAGGGATGGFPQQIAASYSSIGGGYSDTITANGSQSVIAGGVANTASGPNVTIGGGTSNTGSGPGATIGGGTQNTASGVAATIPGGNSNTASGTSSFAAGSRANAIHNGAFVWGDSTPADIASTGNDQFIVRANGGVVINTSSGVTLNASAGEALTVNASNSQAVPVGTLFRDNTIVSWGRIVSSALDVGFNVASVVRNSAGNYTVTLKTSLNSVDELVPMVLVSYSSQPTTAAGLRVAGASPLFSTTSFKVFTNNGSGAAADADFTFMVTGR